MADILFIPALRGMSGIRGMGCRRRMSTLEGDDRTVCREMHAARQGGLSLGKTAVILGASCMASARCRPADLGPGRIVRGLLDCRLEGWSWARMLVNTRAACGALCAGSGEEADIVFETAGSPITM